MPDWGGWTGREWGWILAGVGFALVAFFGVRGWWRGAMRRWSLRRRFAWASKAEDLAAGVLKKSGYKILGREVELTWTVHVDGESVPIQIRADYLVSRDGRSFVAEVKTGRSAPQITSSATRRQLLEYRLAYPVHGVLLVDMERRVVRRVVFPMASTQSAGWSMVMAFVAGAGLGLGAALWWLQR
jgi:hypothetical protein